MKAAQRDSLGPSQSACRSSRAFCGAHNDGPTTDDPRLMADSRCLTMEVEGADEANVGRDPVHLAMELFIVVASPRFLIGMIDYPE